MRKQFKFLVALATLSLAGCGGKTVNNDVIIPPKEKIIFEDNFESYRSGEPIGPQNTIWAQSDFFGEGAYVVEEERANINAFSGKQMVNLFSKDLFSNIFRPDLSTFSEDTLRPKEARSRIRVLVPTADWHDEDAIIVASYVERFLIYPRDGRITLRQIGSSNDTFVTMWDVPRDQWFTVEFAQTFNENDNQTRRTTLYLNSILIASTTAGIEGSKDFIASLWIQRYVPDDKIGSRTFYADDFKSWVVE